MFDGVLNTTLVSVYHLEKSTGEKNSFSYQNFSHQLHRFTSVSFELNIKKYKQFETAVSKHPEE